MATIRTSESHVIPTMTATSFSKRRGLQAWLKTVSVVAAAVFAAACGQFAPPEGTRPGGAAVSAADAPDAMPRVRSEIPDEETMRGPFHAVVHDGEDFVVLAYMVMGADAVVGGDMVIGTVEEVQRHTAVNVSKIIAAGAPEVRDGPLAKLLKQLGAAAGQHKDMDLEPFGWGTNNRIWPVRTVPYRFSKSIPEGPRRIAIREAIASWNAQSPVRLRAENELTPEQLSRSPVVEFRDNDADDTKFACSSGVGYGTASRKQPRYVSLNPSCRRGNIMHEIGHRMGLHHEHQRTDRHRLLTVRRVVNTANYGRLAGRELSPHDLCSIMHYTPNTVRPPWFTLTDAGRSAHALCRAALPRDCQHIGQRCELSATDGAALQMLYDGVPE